MVIRAIILALGVSIGVCSLGPFGQGVLFSEHGSAGAQTAINSGLAMMVVSFALLITFTLLESRRPVVTLR